MLRLAALLKLAVLLSAAGPLVWFGSGTGMEEVETIV
jgi:hypothetical protein